MLLSPSFQGDDILTLLQEKQRKELEHKDKAQELRKDKVCHDPFPSPLMVQHSDFAAG